MTEETLTRQTLRGVAWTAMRIGVATLLQAGLLVVLARLLEPRDFGVVAAALIVINLSIIFTDIGFGAALVQAARVDTSHVRVAFTASVLLGAALWGVIALAAPALAGFFDLPELVTILRVMSAVFLLRNLTVGDYLLQRDLRFRRLAVIDLVSYGVGYGVVAVVLAVAGFGVWAMVAANLGQMAVRTTIVWFVRPHTIKPSLARGPLRELFAFGSGHTLAQIAGYAASQGDNLVVGRMLGPIALGLYSRAYQMMNMSAQLFGQLATQVLFPAMAVVQDDLARLRRAYSRAVAALAVLTLPASVAAAILSREIVVVLLGPEWLELRAAFDIMVFGMLFRTSAKISGAVALAKGAVYGKAVRQFGYAAVVVVGAVAGQRWGLTGVGAGILVALGVNFLAMAQLALGLTEMRWGAFASAHVPGLLLAGGLAMLLYPLVGWMRRVGLAAGLVLALGCVAALVIGIVLTRTARLVPWAPCRQLAVLISGVVPMFGPGRVGRVVRTVLAAR